MYEEGGRWPEWEAAWTMLLANTLLEEPESPGTPRAKGAYHDRHKIAYVDREAEYLA